MVQQQITDKSWQKALKKESTKGYFKELMQRIKEERAKYQVYPPENLLFNAFNKTPFDKVKVVILGQDPYHGPGQAHGLCFSVPEEISIPRSLKNIYKELSSDLHLEIPKHGNLEKWTNEGVLLLNTILTVRAGEPKSHHGFGWEEFTDTVIKILSDEKENLVFLLWGNDAQLKIPLINNRKHCILTAAHPSPFSASRGFFGCNHFSKANHYLIQQNIKPVNWEI